MAGEDRDRADWALIEAFAAEDPQWHRWPGDEGTLLDLGDQETHWVLAERAGSFTFEEIQRGHRTVGASFAAARDARRFLLMRLGGTWRSSRDLPSFGWREPAPDTVLAPGPSGHQLSWLGGMAWFASRFDAVDFSWVAGAGPAEIATSFRDRNGRPLFDLDLPEPEPRPPRPRVPLTPRPVEVPPPDPDAVSELRVVDQVAAGIAWSRRETEGADVLAVGDGQVGRVVTYQRSMFEYRSFVRDWRKTVATFSTAAAARRFLLMDMGATLRTRRRLRIVRVHSAHPQTQLSKGPTQFWLAWRGGTATFPLGYGGSQHALTFSRCARAPLADIVASYADPNGAPIFDLQREHENRPPWHP